MARPVCVLNGPPLNLLGKRQPQIYRHETLDDVERTCRALAAELRLDPRFHQSNREYEIIDWIHEARQAAGGIVINPAAFTHTSVAILHALNALLIYLVDQDAQGELHQAYTEAFQDRFFFEVVERRDGYASFGAANASVRMAARARDAAIRF